MPRRRARITRTEIAYAIGAAMKAGLPEVLLKIGDEAWVLLRLSPEVPKNELDLELENFESSHGQV
jgi:hypothetical protein